MFLHVQVMCQSCHRHFLVWLYTVPGYVSVMLRSRRGHVPAMLYSHVPALSRSCSSHVSVMCGPCFLVKSFKSPLCCSHVLVMKVHVFVERFLV